MQLGSIDGMTALTMGIGQEPANQELAKKRKEAIPGQAVGA
jgi:hypothetical protein